MKHDTDAGRTSLMIAGDADTVAELNRRARADRIAAGQLTETGLDVIAGVVGAGDVVVTRRNDRTLATGHSWVKNGDRWTVTATHTDGSTTIQRVTGRGQVVLPADYVREHVELATRKVVGSNPALAHRSAPFGVVPDLRFGRRMGRPWPFDRPR